MLGGGCLDDHAPVAQRIEHLTTDQKVGGSSPSGRARCFPAQRAQVWLSKIRSVQRFASFSELAVHTFQVDQENLEITQQIHELSLRIEALTAEVHEAVTRKNTSAGAS